MDSPSPEQALAFAIMLQAGVPAGDAILYFVDSNDPGELNRILSQWQRSREVKKAILKLMGKSWQDMTLDERCHHALDLHYSALAYFLYANNYTDLGPQDRAKADTARNAIEAKLAGTSGKMDALSQFLEDVRVGKVKLGQAAKVGLLNGRTDS